MIVSFIYLWAPTLSHALHHGEQVLKDLQNAGSGGDYQHGGENKEEDREHEFDADLAGSLFGVLTASRTHEVGMGAKTLAHAGAEPVVLHKNCNQLAKFGFAGALREIA